MVSSNIAFADTTILPVSSRNVYAFDANLYPRKIIGRDFGSSLL